MGRAYYGMREEFRSMAVVEGEDSTTLEVLTMDGETFTVNVSTTNRVGHDQAASTIRSFFNERLPVYQQNCSESVQVSRMSPCGSDVVIDEFGAIIPRATMDRRVRETR